MTLRALKAGKELSRLLERWSHDRPQAAAASSVESILVDAPSDFSGFLDVDKGLVGRPDVHLSMLLEPDRPTDDAFLFEVTEAIEQPPFSSLGLEIEVDFRDRGKFLRQADGGLLFEFEQSRRASFTKPLTLQAEVGLPRLISTIALDQVVHGDKVSPLELARKEAEKRVIVSELARGEQMPELAARLGIAQAELRCLLVEHGIDEAQQTFGIPVDLPLVNG